MQLSRIALSAATAVVAASTAGVITYVLDTGTSAATPHLHYQKNAKGETFGSAKDANGNVALEPDLISVVATNGNLGYAKKTDLEGSSAAMPTSPAEAATYSPRATTIPVYASDGTTVVGSFVIDAGTVQLSESPSP